MDKQTRLVRVGRVLRRSIVLGIFGPILVPVSLAFTHAATLPRSMPPVWRLPRRGSFAHVNGRRIARAPFRDRDAKAGTDPARIGGARFARGATAPFKAGVSHPRTPVGIFIAKMMGAGAESSGGTAVEGDDRPR